MRWLLPCVLLGLASVAATPSGPQRLEPVLDRRPATVSDTPPEADSLSRLIRTAARVERVVPRLDSVWPGFWPAGQAYLIYDGRTAVLVADDRPPAAWRPVDPGRLPGVLCGMAYRRSGPLPSLTGNFDMEYPVGEGSAAAVPWSGGMFRTLSLLFHERFHAFQQERFTPTRGAGELGQQEETFLSAASVGGPRFRAMAEVERRLLRDALAASDPERTRAILRSYLAVRDERMAGAEEEVRRAEINVERKEGSAEYVGFTAATVATGAGRQRVRKALDERLAMALDTTRLGSGAYAQFRARLYGTGGALAWLLEEMVPDWRSRLAEGSPFPELAARAVGGAAGRSEELAEAALRRKGFGELLARERARGAPEEEDPVRAVLTSGRVTLVLHVSMAGRSPSDLQMEASGGLPRQPEQGLWVNPDVDVLEFSLPGVELTAEDSPAMVDFRSPTDSVRLTLALSGAPRFDGEALPADETRWPEGLTAAAGGVRLRVEAAARTRTLSDSVVVRVMP